MKWVIYGVDNTNDYDIITCDVVFTASEKKEVIKVLKEEVPLIEVDRYSKNGNILKERYTGKRTG